MGPPAYVEIDGVDRPSLSAPPQMSERPYKMGRFSAATRVRRKCNPPSMAMAVAGSSHVNHPHSENLDEGVAKDIALLERLIGGHGLSEYRWEMLFGMCEKCGQHFVPSKLSGHAKVCNDLIILGSSSEVDSNVQGVTQDGGEKKSLCLSWQTCVT